MPPIWPDFEMETTGFGGGPASALRDFTDFEDDIPLNRQTDHPRGLFPPERFPVDAARMVGPS